MRACVRQQGGNTRYLSAVLQCYMHTREASDQHDARICSCGASTCPSCILGQTMIAPKNPDAAVPLAFWRECIDSLGMTFGQQHGVGEFWKLVLARWSSCRTPCARADYNRLRHAVTLPMTLCIDKKPTFVCAPAATYTSDIAEEHMVLLLP